MTAPTARETADHAELARIEALLREHIKVDASGLSPAVVGYFIFGFDTAANALLSEIAALRGERDTWKAMAENGAGGIIAHIDRATQAERQRDELRKALEPFAKAAGKLDGLWSEDDWRWNDSVRSGVTVRDIRRASKALATQGADHD